LRDIFSRKGAKVGEGAKKPLRTRERFAPLRLLREKVFPKEVPHVMKLLLPLIALIAFISIHASQQTVKISPVFLHRQRLSGDE
jgi:hypothetical protein